jgi:exodeoxyribonuclease V beta subunit
MCRAGPTSASGRRLAELEDGNLRVEPAGAPAGPSPPPRPTEQVGTLAARTLTRTLDRRWQRSSFSSLIRARGEEPEADDDGRDLDQHADDLALPDPGSGPLVPLAAMPRGAAIGTFVHAVLEEIDFLRTGDPDHVRAVVDTHLRRSGLEGVDVGQVTTALELIATTPLGPIAAGARLADVSRSDRADELRFDLPVAGGYATRAAQLTLDRVAEVLEAHATDDTLRAAASRLRGRSVAVRGFMTGSIDLLARMGGRWLVVDYKSNWLGGTDPDGSVRSRTGDYHPDRLARVMVEHDYLLQAHLYTVAVHRLLRWRLKGAYDYEACIAGFAYLFVRGMLGPDTPVADDGTPFGVYAATPSRALIEDLDAVIDGDDRRPA